MEKTTQPIQVWLPTALVKRLKIHAVQHGQTLSAVARGALERVLKEERK